MEAYLQSGWSQKWPSQPSSQTQLLGWSPQRPCSHPCKGRHSLQVLPLQPSKQLKKKKLKFAPHYRFILLLASLERSLHAVIRLQTSPLFTLFTIGCKDINRLLSMSECYQILLSMSELPDVDSGNTHDNHNKRQTIPRSNCIRELLNNFLGDSPAMEHKYRSWRLPIRYDRRNNWARDIRHESRNHRWAQNIY